VDSQDSRSLSIW